MVGLGRLSGEDMVGLVSGGESRLPRKDEGREKMISKEMRERRLKALRELRTWEILREWNLGNF